MPQAAIIAVVVAGAALSAYSAAQQGRAAKREAEARAELADRDALISEQQAEQEKTAARHSEEDFRRDQSRLMGTRRSLFAAQGVDADTGSPLLASEDFAAETELQALRIRHGGEVTSTRLQQQAEQQRFEGSLLRISGASAQRAGYTRAGASLLSGAGRAYGIYNG